MTDRIYQLGKGSSLFLVLIAGLLVSVGCRSNTTTVEVRNKTEHAISNLKLSFGGGGCDAKQVDAGAAFSCTVVPSRNSDVVMEYSTPSGGVITKRLDVYVAGGISSNIVASIEPSGDVSFESNPSSR
ncbi:hypothetical protein [Archangium lipolyticum]|uniref:hypothetical protein n=1 Tax=Archangium lipolyticum TaxID=2970465 RepID=UPI00214A7623|nr:hypothetical protein [Archangium lipolyticum]